MAHTHGHILLIWNGTTETYSAVLHSAVLGLIQEWYDHLHSSAQPELCWKTFFHF